MLWPGASIQCRRLAPGEVEGKDGPVEADHLEGRLRERSDTRHSGFHVAYGTGYCHQGLDYTLSAKGLSAPEYKGRCLRLQSRGRPGHWEGKGALLVVGQEGCREVEGLDRFGRMPGSSSVSAKENISWDAHKL